MDAPRFTRASAADAGEILTLQRAAYLTEAQLYGDPFLPPLVETLDDVAAAIAGTHVLVGASGGRICATGRARQDGATLRLGRFAVAPDLQGRGLGSALVAALEALAAPGTEQFELFTGALSEPNLRLYERLGYKETHRGPGRPGIELVYLRKVRTT
ncbi:GNAT family N-acetyltransferase [Glycomyces paridis]|uniref:GNAT family N-acetyltransferase n=1 Tax=Glycomyces paridis TaxID=2126555 RepID=A0A4S8PMK4_9ACTN|nr:GNAT family N-acetyltransferase [Glycomyces paridis]THV31371.1 GNAT family N-acetyltransferase [Glycomyces paridis]